jgi:hypothetical protein
LEKPGPDIAAGMAGTLSCWKHLLENHRLAVVVNICTFGWLLGHAVFYEHRTNLWIHFHGIQGHEHPGQHYRETGN